MTTADLATTDGAPRAQKYPAHIIRRIAVTAECDPRTVEAHLAGKRVQPMIADRISRAVARHARAVAAQSDRP